MMIFHWHIHFHIPCPDTGNVNCFSKNFSGLMQKSLQSRYITAKHNRRYCNTFPANHPIHIYQGFCKL
jgi:hypothetical protein